MESFDGTWLSDLFENIFTDLFGPAKGKAMETTTEKSETKKSTKKSEKKFTGVMKTGLHEWTMTLEGKVMGMEVSRDKARAKLRQLRLSK